MAASFNTLLALMMCAVLLVSAVAHSTSGGATDEFAFLVFPRRCLSTPFETSCVKATISKLLGYGIIAGACVVKVPQIIAVLRSKSVEGMSRGATYFDLLAYLLTAGYHIMHKNPFSAYGETVIITVQSIAIVMLMWKFDFPGTSHTAVVTALLAAVASVPFSLPMEQQRYILLACTVLLITARAQQIFANFSAGSTGQLAFLTLFMNFAGAAARIFTSSQEVKEKEVMISNTIATALNLILVLQYVYYNFMAGKPKARVAAPAAAPVPAPASDKADSAKSNKTPSSKKGKSKAA